MTSGKNKRRPSDIAIQRRRSARLRVSSHPESECRLLFPSKVMTIVVLDGHPSPEGFEAHYSKRPDKGKRSACLKSSRVSGHTREGGGAEVCGIGTSSESGREVQETYVPPLRRCGAQIEMSSGDGEPDGRGEHEDTAHEKTTVSMTREMKFACTAYNARPLTDSKQGFGSTCTHM